MQQAVCHLEWFINSRCDYACRGCIPQPPRKPDLGLEACLEALDSFVRFAASRGADASIAFYPRQAEFQDPFLTVLQVVRDLKREGRLKTVTCVNRGDLPREKIELFRESGVDRCRLTIDGPRSLHDALRRPGGFEDTMTAFREARACGIRVMPMTILMTRNAPHVVDTIRLLMNEGLEDFALQAAIRGDVGGPDAPANLHPDPASPWNRLLTASEYRTVLLDALRLLDSAGSRHEALRASFVRGHQMFARLFFELGRWQEYERLAGAPAPVEPVQFVLKTDGTVAAAQNLPELGFFPGESFERLFETAHPMRWFGQESNLQEYRAARQKAFAKCAECQVRSHCTPMLVGVQDRRLFFQPDVHCWVGET